MRNLAYLVACLSAWVAAYLLFELSGFGFPDGHRTALDRARESAWPIFIGLLACVAVACVVAATKGRWLRLVLAAALTLFAGMVAIDRHLAATLEDGSGG